MTADQCAVYGGRPFSDEMMASFASNAFNSYHHVIKHLCVK